MFGGSPSPPPDDVPLAGSLAKSRQLGCGRQAALGGSKRISGPDNVPHHHGREAGAPSATATGAAGEGEEREQGRTVAGCPGRTPATRARGAASKGRQTRSEARLAKDGELGRLSYLEHAGGGREA
jgi:hypothetical protein